MTDETSLQVTFGANAAALSSAAATAKASIASVAAEARTLATAAAASNTAMIAQAAALVGAGHSARDAAAEAASLTANMKLASHAVNDGGGHGGGGHGGGGWGSVLVEARALFDELSSGRAHQAIGTFTRFETFLGRINPMFSIASLGAIGFGAALFETAKHFQDLQNTADSIRQSAAFSGNFKIVDPKELDEAAAKLRDLKSIWNELGLSDKGFSEEEITKVTSSFAQMGNTSNDTIKAMALAMSGMWQQFGTDEKEASKNIVEVFSKPLAPIDEIAKRLHGLTDEERARLRTAQETASPLQAQAALYDILAQRERQSTAEKRANIQAQIAMEQALIEKIRERGGSSFDLGAQEQVLKGFQDQLAVVDKIGSGLQTIADKMRSAVEPAQNVANAMRDWTKAANPQGAELDKLKEQLAEGEAALARLRNNAASPQGASVFGGLVASGDVAEAEAGIDVLRDKIRKLNEEMSGTNPRLKAEIANLQSENSGKANAVDEAQRILDAAKQNLAEQTTPKFSGPDSENYKAVEQAEKELAEKKIAYAESQAALEIALAGKSYQTRYAAEVKLNEVKRQAANGDPAKLNDAAAERARLDQGFSEQQRADAAEALDQEIADLKDATQQKLKVYEDDAKNHLISAQREADDAQDALQDEQDDLQAMFARKAAMYGDDANKRREIERAWGAENRQINDQIAQQNRKASDATEAAWLSATGAINSAFDAQINGLLTGTESWGTAFKKILADLTEQLIKLGLNKVLTGTENSIGSAVGIPGAQASQGLGSLLTPFTGSGLGAAPAVAPAIAAAGGIGSDAVITANTAAQTAAASAATLNTGATTLNTSATVTGNAGAVAGAAAQAAGTTAQVANTAVVVPNTIATAANTVATQAISFFKAIFPGYAEGTPFVSNTGLALIHQGEAIIPAAKNPFSRIGMPSFDTGAWEIPHNMVAGLHSGEMVVPQRGGIADQFRDFASNGGFAGRGEGGGGANVAIHPTTHVHVNALDGASVGQWFRGNSGEMMRAIDQAVRHGAHLGLRRLTT